MKSDEWLTPPEILNTLGEFDLDPCAPIVRPWSTATKHYTRLDDGLTQSWHGRVWLNPPFGREAAAWLAKLAAHGDGIALIPARTETVMFFDSVWRMASGVLFLQSRPHFYRADGSRAEFNSGAPICLVPYGLHNMRVLHESALGQCVIIPGAVPRLRKPK